MLFKLVVMLVVVLHTGSKGKLAYHPGRLAFLFLSPLGEHTLHLQQQDMFDCKAQHSISHSSRKWRGPTAIRSLVISLQQQKISQVSLVRRTRGSL